MLDHELTAGSRVRQFPDENESRDDDDRSQHAGHRVRWIHHIVHQAFCMFRMPVAFVSQNGRSGKKDSANRSHARNHDNDAPQNLIRYPQPSLARSGTCGHRATDSPTAAFLKAEISTLADEMPRRLLLSTNPETSSRFRYSIRPVSSAVFLR